jgi:phosphomannomutase
MSYFANGSLGADAGIMITASHNPAEYNGFKLSRREAVPISGDTGIRDIERIVEQGAYDPPARRRGTVTDRDVLPAYVAHIRRHAALRRPLRIAADMANAMGVLEARVFDGVLDVEPLFADLDGSFPNHEANPLNHETLAALQQKLRGGGFDFGVAFDGDADRAGFLDETGAIVPMDMITALIASDILAAEKGVILYDLRSSWAVKEVILENGGTPIMSRVGHAFIKQQMRENRAVFAGELSGHYYFRDNYFTESSSLAALRVANIVSRSDRPLSALVAPLRRYSASGELNSTVKDPAAVLERLRRAFTGAGGRLFELDGVSVEFEDWWFNVRCSNTEPLVRLNLEARTHDLMARRRDELLALIRG